MAMTINTNVASLNAQRNLGLSGGSLSTSMQRLSSGLRVNSAKDDAAGLAIAERMTAATRGLSVAARNANDGISLAQTAEGALGKVGDMLQRMRELAVQSSNATNSADDRKALQAEVSQLASEIDRVAKTSSFNGKKLLDGSFSGGVFQVGANAGDNITVGALVDTRTSQMGKTAYTVGSAVEVGTGSAADLAASTGVSLTGEDDSWTTSTSAAGAGISMSVVSADGTKTTYFNLGKFEAATSAKARAGELVSRINEHTAETGVTAFMEENATSGKWEVKLMSSDIKDTDGTMSGAAVGFSGVTASAFGVDGGSIGFAATDVTSASSAVALDEIDITTQSGAWEAMKQLDTALDQVNAARGQLGALQTRFEKTVENIDIMNENVAAARGRIIDADFAVETANLSRSQILQQAGTAMVAQANQLTQNVLSLLR